MSYINNSHYKAGCWNVICDVCGFRFKSDEVRKRWDNLIVCKEDWETDHPQKYIRARSDPKPVPFVRPEPTPIIIPVCTMQSKSAIPGNGLPGCLIPSEINVTSFYRGA